jgi:hypothetical protein
MALWAMSLSTLPVVGGIRHVRQEPQMTHPHTSPVLADVIHCHPTWDRTFLIEPSDTMSEPHSPQTVLSTAYLTIAMIADRLLPFKAGVRPLTQDGILPHAIYHTLRNLIPG